MCPNLACFLQGQYKNLMAMAQERHKKLSETVQAYVLVREAAELSQWIKDKEQHAQIEDVGEDLEQVCTIVFCSLGDFRCLKITEFKFRFKF